MKIPMDYKMETRECVGGCGLTFRCLTTSRQERARSDGNCSHLCKKEIEGIDPRNPFQKAKVHPDARFSPRSLEKRRRLESERMVSSSTAGPGAESPPSSNEEKPVEKGTVGGTGTILNFEKETSRENEHSAVANTKSNGAKLTTRSISEKLITDEQSERVQQESSHEKNGESGMQRTEKDIVKTNVIENGNAIQLQAFIAPSLNTKGEKFQPKNFLDDTIVQLHGLMNSVVEDVPATKKLEAAKVKLTAARELRETMKLKLEIYRESRVL